MRAAIRPVCFGEDGRRGLARTRATAWPPWSRRGQTGSTRPSHRTGGPAGRISLVVNRPPPPARIMYHLTAAAGVTFPATQDDRQPEPMRYAPIHETADRRTGRRVLPGRRRIAGRGEGLLRRPDRECSRRRPGWVAGRERSP